MLKTQGGGVTRNKDLEITLEALVTEAQSVLGPPTDQGRVFTQREAQALFGVGKSKWDHLTREFEAEKPGQLRRWQRGKEKVVCEVDLKGLAKWIKEQK